MQATKLGAGLSAVPSLEVEPVLANEVFTLADASFIEAMRARGHVFLDFSVLGTRAHALRCCCSDLVATDGATDRSDGWTCAL